MVTFWLLIDTIAMTGSPSPRAASAGGAAVSAVRAAVAASVTIAGGAHRRTMSVDWTVVHRFVMPCPESSQRNRVQTITEKDRNFVNAPGAEARGSFFLHQDGSPLSGPGRSGPRISGISPANTKLEPYSRDTS